MLRKIFTTFLLFLCVSGVALAQGNLAKIEGVALNKEKKAMVGATIVITNHSTGFQTGAITNEEGKYSVGQLPLGEPYSVEASYLGYETITKSGIKLGQGDLVRVNFDFDESSDMAIDEVVVNNENFQKKTERIGAVTSVTAQTIQTMPVNGRDFTALSDLSPLTSGNSLAGQIATATNYSLDGMSATGTTSGGQAGWGPYAVSMEAISEFEVITNSYDVTLGRGGGGTISAVTKSGTNTLQGSAFIYSRADQLSSKYNANGNINTNEYSQTQYGFTLGGAIVKNKAHFFVSFETQMDARPLIIADLQTEEDEDLFNISKENLDRYLEIAYDQYGVSREHQQVGTFDKRTPSTTATARIDWQINDKNLLTVRNNLNNTVLDLGVSDNANIEIFESYANHKSFDNSLLATLRTIVDNNKTNELKVQHRYILDDGTTGDLLPDENMPRALVEGITSDFDNDGNVDATLGSIQLGGQRYSPERFSDNSFQIVDNFYITQNNINWTLGADMMFTHLNSLATSEMNGRFYYSGLDAFEANTPYRYAREIAINDPTVTQSVLNGALYAQADIALAKGLSIEAGLRADYTHYFQNPTENELLQSELGLSTTNKVRSFQLQPRFQLTWDVNEKHTDIIKIGGGIVGSNMNNYAMINNLQFDGNNIYSIDIMSSAGYELPTADFEAYRKDPSSAPGYELFDKLGIEPVATYNINSADLKMPVTYKYSFSYNKFFTPSLRASVSFYGANTRNNYMYVDANMVDDPFFTLENEGGRGVYVPASTIDTKGNTDWTQGKKSDKIGRVLELISEGTINSYSFVADASWRYFKDGQITASYTWNDTKDNTSYNGNVANSATLYRQIIDDPRAMDDITYSDNQFRHKFVVYGNTPSFWGINLGFRYSGIGGKRYSAVVNGNINGDFVPTYQGNDLAFIFDPNDASTPSHIAEGINEILNNPDADQGFKDYLTDNFGKVAERNGGENGFYGVLDLKLSKTFKLVNNHRLQLSVDAFNVMNMINKEWGLSYNLSKQTLYYVTGFDQGSQEFTYSVNKKAGVAYASGNPWQIQIGAKYTF